MTEVEVRLSVDPAVLSTFDGSALARRVEAELVSLLGGLGVVVTASVTVAALDDGVAVAVLTVGEDDTRTYTEDELPGLSALGIPPDLATMPPDELVALLAGIARDLAARDVPGLVAAADLGPHAEAVRHLLDLWIRVPRADVLANAVAELDDLPESLVAALRPPQVRLRIAPDYLRALTGLQHDDAFRAVRWRLRRRLGVAPPPLHLEPAPDLAGLLFQPVVNDVAALPVLGIDPDLIVVEATPADLRDQGLDPVGVPPNPGLSLLPATDRDKVGAYTCWTAVELVAYWWESYAPWFTWRTFDERDTERVLAWLRPAVPALVRIADGLPTRWLTGRLRSSYRENFDLLNLPVLL